MIPLFVVENTVHIGHIMQDILYSLVIVKLVVVIVVVVIVVVMMVWVSEKFSM
jgi:hypothetical protein